MELNMDYVTLENCKASCNFSKTNLKKTSMKRKQGSTLVFVLLPKAVTNEHRKKTKAHCPFVFMNLYIKYWEEMLHARTSFHYSFRKKKTIKQTTSNNKKSKCRKIFLSTCTWKKWENCSLAPEESTWKINHGLSWVVNLRAAAFTAHVRWVLR